MKTKMLGLEKIEQVAFILKAIGHPLRIRVIDLLRKDKELTVNQLCELLDAEQSLLSQHLAKMKLKGVLGNRRAGKNVYYFLKLKEVLKVMDCMESCQLSHL